jgi:hypothetical protein
MVMSGMANLNLGTAEDDGVTGRLVIGVGEDVGLFEPHEEAIARLDHMGPALHRQFEPAGEKPDVLGNAAVSRLALEDDACSRRKLDLDDIDRRADALRRDRSAQIAAFRIAPEPLLRPPCQRRGARSCAVGLASPRSMREIMARLTPERVASSSSVRAWAVRSSCTRSPIVCSREGNDCSII